MEREEGKVDRGRDGEEIGGGGRGVRCGAGQE